MPAGPTPILVDQFGYLPGSAKVAVLVDPQRGFNENDAFEPGDSIEVRRFDDASVVAEGSAVEWNGGAVDEQAGDRGWWFDFSTVTDEGEYVVVDVDSGIESHPFRIGADVYDDVLAAALRMFWFNRANTTHDTEGAGFWTSQSTLLGEGQDSEARWVDSPSADTARDLSGGWHDAGDTNKYVTFASVPVHQLLSTYEAYPQLFGDDLGITESGNGIADLLDEVRWEVEWVEKMQNEDGGVLLKVGFKDWAMPVPLEEDPRPRFYEEACSSSTIAAAGMFAHAALAYRQIDPAWSAALGDRAGLAWDWYETNSRSDSCDPQIVRAGDADRSLAEQDGDAFTAAAYLFELTGDQRYHDVIESNLETTRAWIDAGLGRYAPDQVDAMTAYMSFDDADASIVATMVERLDRAVDVIAVHGFDPSASLYRSYLPDPQYHWGSNMVMANTGNSNLALLGARADRSLDDDLIQRAGAHLSTLHGVNPLGLVYLSNMVSVGGERSVEEFFHYWFADGTDYDNSVDSLFGPPPGYLVGGPNSTYSGTTTPPAGQPLSKSYFDWNADTDVDRSWEISEPAIYYQSAYVQLIAGMIANQRTT